MDNRKQTLMSDIDIMNVLDQTDNTELGRLVTEYVNESYDTNWEGFNTRQKSAIQELLSDLCLYIKNAN